MGYEASKVIQLFYKIYKAYRKDLIKYLKEPSNPPLEGNDELDDEYVGIRKNIEVLNDSYIWMNQIFLLGTGE